MDKPKYPYQKCESEACWCHRDYGESSESDQQSPKELPQNDHTSTKLTRKQRRMLKKKGAL